MSLIFEPFKLRNVALKNRIVMSSMLMYIAENDGKVNDFHFAHYAARALGGVGLVMMEVAAVEKRGRISLNDIGLWDDSHIEGLKRISSFVQSCGTKAGIQLAHAGRKAVVDEPIVAPSPIAYSDSSAVPLVLTLNEIKDLVGCYRDAAARADKAGFDVIEIHAGHGYLVHEFLSPIANKRKDEYGGSFENRTRFLTEIVQAVRTVWPEEKPFFLRISAEDHAQGGITLEESIQLIKKLRSMGIDFLDVSAGSIIPGEEINVFPGYQVRYSETIRKEVGIPTGAVGSITSSEHVDEILSSGRADLVFMGRELLRNPFWVWETAKKLNVDIELPISTYSRATDPYQRGH